MSLLAKKEILLKERKSKCLKEERRLRSRLKKGITTMRTNAFVVKVFLILIGFSAVTKISVEDLAGTIYSVQG